MVEVFVDSASLYSVVFALVRGHPKESYTMEWDNALEVTVALIRGNQVRVPPSIHPEREASGPYGVLMTGLTEFFSIVNIEEKSVAKAMTRTKEWARRNRSGIGSQVRQIITAGAESPYSKWIEAHIRHEWVEHISRRGSLLDGVFEHQIASILNTSVSEIGGIRKMSADADLVRGLIKHRPAKDNFRMLRDAFITSALLRGHYYNQVAALSGRQIVAHPIRRETFKEDKKSIRIEISSFERYLCNIVIAGALSETSADKRVSLWVENIKKIRSAQKSLNFGGRQSDQIARDDAIREAKRLNIRVHARFFELCIDAIVQLGCIGLSSFYLKPYTSAGLSVVIVGLGYARPIGAKIASTYQSHTLQHLSELGPGSLGQGTNTDQNEGEDELR